MNDAKASPDGFIAQRWPVPINDRRWLLIRVDPHEQMQLQALTDADVADWPTLRPPAPPEVAGAAQRLRAEHAITADMRTVLDWLANQENR